jgi:hypothetical protein
LQQGRRQLEQLTVQQQEEPSRPGDQSVSVDAAAGIVSGQPLIERKSTFQAHLAPIHSREDVAAVMATLMQNKKVQKVQRSNFVFGCKDSECTCILVFAIMSAQSQRACIPCT